MLATTTGVQRMRVLSAEILVRRKLRTGTSHRSKANVNFDKFTAAEINTASQSKLGCDVLILLSMVVDLDHAFLCYKHSESDTNFIHFGFLLHEV